MAPRSVFIQRIATALLTSLVMVGHVFYWWRFSLLFYKLSGGIQESASGWTQFGGARFAWEIPLQLPGTVLFRTCQLWRASDQCLGAIGICSLALWVFTLLATAYAISAVAISLVTQPKFSWGRFYWRAIIIFLGLAWIPVREDFASVWQYTVSY